MAPNLRYINDENKSSYFNVNKYFFYDCLINEAKTATLNLYKSTV